MADAAGVAALAVEALIGTIVAVRGLLRRQTDGSKAYRRFLGRSILLGPELVVPADIIRTVAISPTIERVAMLAAIVLIRTFLSFSLELDITGRRSGGSEQAPAQVPAQPRSRRTLFTAHCALTFAVDGTAKRLPVAVVNRGWGARRSGRG